jgi:hypothetical protein
MVTLLIVIGILYALVGIPNSVMDKISFHYNQSIFMRLNSRYWYPLVSWSNKWKNGEKKNGEQFPLSSTILVFLTDGWHFTKWIMFTLIELIIMLLIASKYSWVWYCIPAGIVVLKCLRGGVFELFFSYILVLDDPNEVYTLLDGDKPGMFYAYNGADTIPATGDSRNLNLAAYMEVKGEIKRVGPLKRKVLIVTKIIGHK